MKRRSAFVLALVLVLFTICSMVKPSVSKANGIVIVLDPGHGGKFVGASYLGIQEEIINLKVAQYTKAELETYEGVTVILTRESNTELASSLQEDLFKRVELGKKNGAVAVVSQHFNATNAHTASGALAFVSFKDNIKSQSVGLANSILNQISLMGLTNRGCIETQSGQYNDPSGVPADYYAINRHGATLGIPAIIIEHCFMDHPYDQTFIQTEEGLKAFGIADATGIAQYYGLSKKGNTEIPETPQDPDIPQGPAEPTESKITIQTADGSYAAVEMQACSYAKVASGEVICNLADAVTVGTVLKQTTVKGNASVTIQDGVGNVLSPQHAVTTGQFFVISDKSTGAKLASYPCIRFGDVNGDGRISLLDLSYIESYLLGRMQLDTNQKLAADVAIDGEIKLLDLSYIESKLLGRMDIQQKP